MVEVVTLVDDARSRTLVTHLHVPETGASGSRGSRPRGRGVGRRGAGLPVHERRGAGGRVFDDVIEQPADVTFVLDALMGDTWIDRERVAVAGFSLGALTVDGATFDRARRHRRIRAAIAMSGRLSPFGGGYEVAGVPLFAVHGVREDVAAYEQATPPVQGRGWTLAPRDSGPEAGVHSWKGH